MPAKTPAIAFVAIPTMTRLSHVCLSPKKTSALKSIPAITQLANPLISDLAG